MRERERDKERGERKFIPNNLNVKFANYNALSFELFTTPPTPIKYMYMYYIYPEEILQA